MCEVLTKKAGGYNDEDHENDEEQRHQQIREPLYALADTAYENGKIERYHDKRRNQRPVGASDILGHPTGDRKSTRLNSSHAT